MNKKETIWSPDKKRVKNSNIAIFNKILLKKNFLHTKSDFTSLWLWSVKNPKAFWSEIWDFVKIIGFKGNKILQENSVFYKNNFFPDAKLNYAENLLKNKNNKIAINFLSECGLKKSITWKNLYNSVCKLSSYLKTLNLSQKDRIAAYVPNSIETIIFFLASAKNGYIWSSCSPDFGEQGVIDRFLQIKPKILVTCDIYYYKGKKINILEKIPKILEKIPSIKKVIVYPYAEDFTFKFPKNYINYKKIIKYQKKDETFEKFNFNHPIYILYSSGTTGVPKCITHGAGNVLIEHKKEFILHCNIKLNDNVFYYTSTGWMMWNWLVSALSCGASISLFDGAPNHPKIDTLLKYCSNKKFSLFGVSAKYIDYLKKENYTKKNINLKNLKTITSTGSPLVKESFKYIYQKIKKNVHLSSISGGTDVVGCLVLGNLFSNIYMGEIQGPSLGIDVDVFDEKGNSVTARVKGELVIKKPFPSMPIKFWNDKNNKKYHKAYFNKFKNIWHHGDFIEKTTNNGFIIHGRSDTTLNPGGVRIGTAEIYQQVENIDFISEAIAVDQKWKNDVRIVLFVITKKNISLNSEKINIIKNKIRFNCSPKHVPAKIISIMDIPKTKSGKIVELAVKKVIHNEEIDNIEALANPKCLELFKNLKELQE